jgi:hypothetical protein
MLVALLLVPLLAAFLAYLMANRTARVFAVLVSLLELGLVFLALHQRAPEFNVDWIPALGIAMSLKLTSLNILMLILCPLLAGCAALATSERLERLSEYCGHLLLSGQQSGPLLYLLRADAAADFDAGEPLGSDPGQSHGRSLRRSQVFALYAGWESPDAAGRDRPGFPGTDPRFEL